MYLYIPKGGRSIVVGVHTISSTGMAFPERVAELDDVLDDLLDRQGEEVAMLEPEPETVLVPAVEETVVSAAE